MDKATSEKLKMGSLLCTIMVICRHSRNLQAFWGTESLNNVCSYIENGLSVLTEIAVPYFFVLSGMFFFRKSYYDNGNYWDMCKTKLKTLVVPFVIWNFVGSIILYLAGEYQYDNISNYILRYFDSGFNGPLWYVRNLIVLMSIVPLYDWIYQKKNLHFLVLTIFILFILWHPVMCNWYSIEGCFFFCIGGLIIQNDRILKWKMERKILVTFSVLWILSSFIRYNWDLWMNKFNTMLGLVCFWQLLNYLPVKVKVKLVPMTHYTFFIYVMHVFLIKTMKILMAQSYRENAMAALFAYFIFPVITFYILLYIGKLWKKIEPRSFSICMGGRI